MPPKNQRQPRPRIGKETNNEPMSEHEDEKSTEELSTTLTTPIEQPFVPHALLKLPQSIASALASDFLVKREIRDLGVTCRWMLLSLNGCIIREEVSLRFAVGRLDRQRSVSGSSQPKARGKTLAFRHLFSRLPNIFIGRFSSIRFTTFYVTEAEMSDLGELSQLVDARKLILAVCSCPFKLRRTLMEPILPLALPPKLVELAFERGHNHEILPLQRLILPIQLQRISWSPEAEDFMPLQHFTQVNWPAGLKALVNMHSEKVDGLPHGLTTLAFDSKMISGSPPCNHMTNILLPNSLTNLNIKWSDVTGRYYHDLPFPPQLKRLVLRCQLENNDFNLNEWAHLPKSCQNIQLSLWVSFHSLGIPVDSILITIPAFVTQFRLFYTDPLLSLMQPSRLCLTHAVALIAMETNQLVEIDWPSISSSSPNPVVSDSAVGLLSSLKLDGDSSCILASNPELPHIRQLDLSSVSDLDPICLYLIPSPWKRLIAGATNLERIKLNRIDSPDLLETLRSFSRTRPQCLIECNIQPKGSKSRDPQSTAQFAQFMNGELVRPLLSRSYAQAMEWMSERERYDIIPPD